LLLAIWRARAAASRDLARKSRCFSRRIGALLRAVDLFVLG